MKRIVILVIAILLSLISISCLAEESTTITFDAEAYSVPVGKSITLKPVISPKSNMKLEWFSSDEAVLSVSSKGAVKAVAEGEAVITVRFADNPEVTASCTITVVLPVKKITLSDKSVSLACYTMWRLKAEVQPENATNKSLVWSSSNEQVAMVSEDGVVTAMSKKGTATITAAAVDGSNVKASVKVNVADYNMVFTTPFTQEGSYTYSFTGYFSLRGSTKKHNVLLSDADTDISGYVQNGTGHFKVTPLKAGTDTIVLKTRGSSLKYSVFIHPDTFKIQDLGFGRGAIVKPGELGVYNGHTYQIFKDWCTWSEAKEKCKQAGGHLATITSPDEQKYMELLNSDNKTLWFGLYKGTGDQWKWVTKEEFIYTHWANGEPNDYGTREYPFENVGTISQGWNDCHENNRKDIYGYVCEWDEMTIDVDSVIEEGEVIESNEIGVLNNHTYKIINEKCTWREAKKKCEALGGHLVTVTSPSEHRFLCRLNSNNKTLWLGLRKGNDDSWNWVTGEETVITVWAQGEPNNYWTKEYPHENVVAMRPDWNDYHENNIADIDGFICEWDVVTDEAGVSRQRIEEENAQANEQETADQNREIDQRIITAGKLGTFDGHTYKVFDGEQNSIDNAITWERAKKLCEEQGGHLVTITSVKEQSFINKLLGNSEYVWIGLHKNESGAWGWITGEKLRYTNWADKPYYDSWDNDKEEWWMESGLLKTVWYMSAVNGDFKIQKYICEWDSLTDEVGSGH